MEVGYLLAPLTRHERLNGTAAKNQNFNICVCVCGEGLLAL